jgi:hypothetical protein
MHKTYEKPSLKRVASLQNFTAAPPAYASYCDLVPSALLADLPEECETPPPR